ncbi:hypothetical protein ACIQW7_24295 [Peribacillus simplex]|uniref:hypothetical protein n=1 Tax=Peribacillus simplex TaxID=1478 RepID=UPI0038079666
MLINKVISYLGAWENLIHNYTENYLEIVESVKNLNSQDHIHNNRMSLKELSSYWRLLLKECGWSKEKYITA